MSIHESNRTQADFWTAAGTLWTALRERFDAQANAHGLAAIDALAPVPGEAVIDVGCGAGTCTLQIATRVGGAGTVHGVDISPTMIDGATDHASQLGIDNVTFSVGDAMVEPFAETFDAVYSRFGVMFFADATAAFANILSALRPHGRIGFVCWQSPAENPWVSLPLEIAGRYVDIPFGGAADAPGPFSLGNIDRLGSVLGDAGFTEVAIEPRSSPATIGGDVEEAADFLTKLIPPVAALEADRPDRAAELRIELTEALGDWMGPEGVQAPSAVWIVTGRRPGE